MHPERPQPVEPLAVDARTAARMLSISLRHLRALVRLRRQPSARSSHCDSRLTPDRKPT
jgi:hypothetical protein